MEFSLVEMKTLKQSGNQLKGHNKCIKNVKCVVVIVICK